MEKVKLALLYIRNGKETIFPVSDIDQAVKIADAIADSDLLNDAVDYNMFDVFQYLNGEIGEAWEDENGQTFEEYWNLCRDSKYGKPNFDDIPMAPFARKNLIQHGFIMGMKFTGVDKNGLDKEAHDNMCEAIKDVFESHGLTRKIEF